jgi:hypothetical protein
MLASDLPPRRHRRVRGIKTNIKSDPTTTPSKKLQTHRRRLPMLPLLTLFS